jgi:hypothetical protein
MSLKDYTAWTVDELWQHEQLNFSIHIAIMFQYVKDHGLDVDEFVRYTGEKVIPAWRKREDTVPVVMNGILRNVLANGASVLEAEIGTTEAHATVTSLLRLDLMEPYGVGPEEAGRFWNKFIPIAEALGMRFSWKRDPDGRDRIELVKSM